MEESPKLYSMIVGNLRVQMPLTNQQHTDLISNDPQKVGTIAMYV